MTIAEAIELFLEDTRLRNAPTAQYTYAWHARRILEDWGPETRLDSITRRQAQQWADRLGKTMRPASVRHLLSALARCYRLAWDAGEDVTAPLSQLRLPRLNNRRERVLTEEEEQRLAAQLTLDRYSVVKFALHTGLRRLEQWRLRVEDVQIREHSTVPGPMGPIRVLVGLARIGTSKTGRGRMCPLNPVAAVIADGWARRSRDGLLFPGGKDRAAAAKMFADRHFVPACARAGIEGLRWHDLRHTCASRALARGARPEQIQRLLGHQSITMTERYMHWSEDALWPAAMALAAATGK